MIYIFRQDWQLDYTNSLKQCLAKGTIKLSCQSIILICFWLSSSDFLVNDIMFLNKNSLNLI